MSVEGIKEQAFKLGEGSIRFLNNTVMVANNTIEMADKAKQQIGTVAIDGSTDMAKESFKVGKESLVLTGKLSNTVFVGTNEIAKIAFSETGRITFIAFNGAAGIAQNIFGAINFTAQAMGSQIKKHIDSKGDITDYVKKYGYDDKVKNKLKNQFLSSVSVITRIIRGVLRDLNYQLDFILKSTIHSMGCKYNFLYYLNCPEDSSYKIIKNIELKIKETRNGLFGHMRELKNRIMNTQTNCISRINTSTRENVDSLLISLNKDVENMLNISKLYDFYNTKIDVLNSEIDKVIKTIEPKSIEPGVNQNKPESTVPEQIENTADMKNLDKKITEELVELNSNNPGDVELNLSNPGTVNPVNSNPGNSNPGPVNTEPVNTGNVNTENSNPGPVNTAGGRKSRRKKHRKSKAKKSVGKRMKTHRRIRRR